MRLQAIGIIKRFKWVALSALFIVSQFGPLSLLASGVAKASPVYGLDSSLGIWTAVSGGSNVNGVNTNEVRWGNSEGQQSGLRFDGSGSQTFNENDKISLGKLTHFNFPITNAANGATLKITLKFNAPGVAPDPMFTFNFDINETSNTRHESDCAAWHTPGYPPCDDMITFPNSYPTQNFTIGDKLYTLKINGFSTTTDGSNPISQFITHEGQSNEAYLIGSLSSVLVEAPQLTLVKKTVEGQDANVAPGPSLMVGDTAHFAYIVQNTGNVTLTNITIVDDKGVAATCAQTTLAAGDSTTCTGTQPAVAGQYTNVAYATGLNGTQKITSNTDPANYFGTPRPGNLKVIKTVQNPNGGSATSANFNVHVNDSLNAEVIGSPAAGSATGTLYSLAPATYTVSEDDPSGMGYKQVSITCDGQNTNTVTVSSDTTKVCTIINEDLAPSITLVKAFSGDKYGDTTSLDDFGLSIGGTTVNSGQKYSVKANTTYAINETGHTGYQFYSIGGDAKCPTVKGGNTVALNPGENITCTITNTARAPYLNVTKNVVNDNGGGKYAWDFKLYANNVHLTDGRKGGGDVNNSSATYVHSNAQDGEHTLVGAYTLSEDTATGYTANSWSCTGNSVPLNGSTITVKLGENVNCEITNNDDTPALTLIKKLGETYGSQATVSDWMLNATGTLNPPTNLSGKTGTADATSGSNFKADTYTLGESGPTGFTASWSCKNNMTGAIAEVTQPLAIALGQNYTCTVTNTGIQPKLIVKKHVVNDNGGSKSASNFTMTVSGNSQSVSNFAGDENGTEVLLNEGSYSIDELDDSGYTKSLGENCSGNIAVGQTKTCVVTNNDIAPKLTLKKSVINDNGGNNGAQDWTLEAMPGANNVGALALSGNGKDGVVEAVVVSNLGYALYENYNSPSGYSPVGWSCDSGVLVGTTITLNAGDNVTCTVTNDDVAPSLVLNKIVKNDNGGKAAESSWTLTATGTGDDPTNLSGAGASGDSDVSSGAKFMADTYTLSESDGPSGYTASAWTCTNGVTVNENNQITLTVGESTVCSITNDDQKGTLIVKKIVENDDGGTKTAGDFSFTLGDHTYWFNEDDDNPLLGEVQIPVNAGLYTVTEDQEDQNGYDTDYDVDYGCGKYDKTLQSLLNLDQIDENSDCAKDCEDLFVGNGKEVVCTITNDDIAPTLTLVKSVINDNSGTSKSSDWTLTATPVNDDYNATVISGNGYDGVDHKDAKANVAYTLSESGPSGYTAGTWWCDYGELKGNVLTLGLDEEVACYITNDDIAHPAIHVVKSGPASAKPGDTVTYTFTVTNTGDTLLGSISVLDNIAGNAVYQSGDTNNNQILETTETWIYTAPYTIPSSAVTQVNNTVKSCGTELLQQEEDVLYRLLSTQSETDGQDPATATICDEDSHTLTVEHPAELVNTSGPATISMVIGTVLLLGALLISTPSRYWTLRSKNQ